MMKPYSVIVFGGDASTKAFALASPRPCVRVNSHAELVAQSAIRRLAVAFVDYDLLPQLDQRQLRLPVVAVMAESSRPLPTAIEMLAAYPWLSHTLSVSVLANAPVARDYLEQFLDRVFTGAEHRVLGATGVGRIAMLASASRREERFARMREFFERHKLSDRTASAVLEVAEELVMNALYDAPFEAGYFKSAVPRSENIDLPTEHACEISYGIERDEVFVRLRDTFGALTRERLVEVLSRCSATGVALDESRGGAGLGLWRIFSVASTVSLTVIEGQVTDIIVSMSTQRGRHAKALRAIDLFFTMKPAVNDWLDSVPNQVDMLDDSITLIVRV
jgi:hypothetical protein